jgi:hypothetical protein
VNFSDEKIARILLEARIDKFVESMNDARWPKPQTMTFLLEAIEPPWLRGGTFGWHGGTFPCHFRRRKRRLHLWKKSRRRALLALAAVLHRD